MKEADESSSGLFGGGTRWWLVVGALAVLVFAASMYISAMSRRQAERKGAISAREDIPPLEEPRPTRPEEVPAWLKDPSCLKDVAKSEGLLDTAFYYLLYQMKTCDLAKLAGEATPAGSVSDWGKTEAGAAVSLDGTLTLLRKCPDAGLPEAGIVDVMQCQVKDGRGKLYVVHTANDVTGTEAGDHVKVAGRFLREYPCSPTLPERPSRAGAPPKEGTEPTPIIMARELDAPDVVKNASVLKDVTDDTRGQEPRAFYYLVHQVQIRTQEELKAAADPSLTPGVIARDPAAARGKVVAAAGPLRDVRQREELPNVAGLRRVYRCIIDTPDGYHVWAYTLEHPGGIKAGPTGDTVKVYGIFFKTEIYTDRRSSEQKALVLLARSVVPVKYEESSALGWVVAAVITALILVLAAALLIERRGNREFDAHLRGLSARLRKERLDGSKGPGAGGQ